MTWAEMNQRLSLLSILVSNAWYELIHFWYLVLFSISFSTAHSTPSVKASFLAVRHSTTMENWQTGILAPKLSTVRHSSAN